jgi:hypothetical protein
MGFCARHKERKQATLMQSWSDKMFSIAEIGSEIDHRMNTLHLQVDLATGSISYRKEFF